MSILDAAIFVISGVEGIEAQTTVIWNMLQKMNVPTILFINKLDRMGADYNRVLTELRESLSNRMITLQNITNNHELAITSCSPAEILEQLAEFDDISLEKFLDNESVDAKWIDRRIGELYCEKKVFCVLGGSALSELGVSDLIQAVHKYIPTFKKINDCTDVSAETYMVKRNDGVKEIYVKILSGELMNRDIVSVYEDNQKVKTLTGIEGNKRIALDSANEGQLVILTGIDCSAGDVLGINYEQTHKRISVSPMFTAVLSITGEEEKIRLWNAAKELNEEDSFLNVRLNPDTNDIQIDLMGKLQGETVV